MGFFISFSVFRFFLFALIAIPCAICDSYTLKAPRLPLIALIITLIVSSVYSGLPTISFQMSFVGAFLGMLIFYSARKLSDNGLGLADVWMAGSIGALGGYPLCVISSVLSLCIIGVLSRGTIKTHNRTPLPFLPVLVSSSLLIFFLTAFLVKK